MIDSNKDAAIYTNIQEAITIRSSLLGMVTLVLLVSFSLWACSYYFTVPALILLPACICLSVSFFVLIVILSLTSGDHSEAIKNSKRLPDFIAAYDRLDGAFSESDMCVYEDISRLGDFTDSSSDGMTSDEDVKNFSTAVRKASGFDHVKCDEKKKPKKLIKIKRVSFQNSAVQERESISSDSSDDENDNNKHDLKGLCMKRASGEVQDLQKRGSIKQFTTRLETIEEE